jgi:hypothetical protein
MGSIDGPHPGTTHRRSYRGRAAADHLACLLVFSMGGLLTDCLALLMQGETSLALSSFALIAGAAPLAAMVALRFCR